MTRRPRLTLAILRGLDHVAKLADADLQVMREDECPMLNARELADAYAALEYVDALHAAHRARERRKASGKRRA